MLPRVLETEEMATVDEVVDYDAMDHAEVNRAFVSDLLAAGLGPGEVLDLGTGTALIPIELCRQQEDARILAVDVSPNMIILGLQNANAAGFGSRIRLERVDAKQLPYHDNLFGTVMSNSIVHHVPEPRGMLFEAWRVTAPGGRVFIRDLFRPDSEAEVNRLADLYAGGGTPLQRKMLVDSLCASLTVDEVRALVAELGVPTDSVQATSDRHWTWSIAKS